MNLIGRFVFGTACFIFLKLQNGKYDNSLKLRKQRHKHISFSFLNFILNFNKNKPNEFSCFVRPCNVINRMQNIF